MCLFKDFLIFSFSFFTTILFQQSIYFQQFTFHLLTSYYRLKNDSHHLPLITTFGKTNYMFFPFSFHNNTNSFTIQFQTKRRTPPHYTSNPRLIGRPATSTATTRRSFVSNPRPFGLGAQLVSTVNQSRSSTAVSFQSSSTSEFVWNTKISHVFRVSGGLESVSD